MEKKSEPRSLWGENHLPLIPEDVSVGSQIFSVCNVSGLCLREYFGNVIRNDDGCGEGENKSNACHRRKEAFPHRHVVGGLCEGHHAKKVGCLRFCDFGHDSSLHSFHCLVHISEVNLTHYVSLNEEEKTSGKNGNKKSNCSSSSFFAPDCPVENPDEIDEKYWKRRYNYFSRFDYGIQMDKEAWFEVTPESVAVHLSDRFEESGIERCVDGTCGVGGNTCHFGLVPRCKEVLAIDVDPKRLLMARNNATIYGVKSECITFVHDSFMDWSRKTANESGYDAIFLSPPWGGPAYLDASFFSLKHVQSCDLVDMCCSAMHRTNNLVMYLPRNMDLRELCIIAGCLGFAEIEVEKVTFNYPVKHLKLICVYFAPKFVKFARRRMVERPFGHHNFNESIISMENKKKVFASRIGEEHCGAGAGCKKGEDEYGPVNAWYNLETGKTSSLLSCSQFAGPVYRSLYLNSFFRRSILSGVIIIQNKIFSEIRSQSLMDETTKALCKHFKLKNAEINILFFLNILVQIFVHVPIFYPANLHIDDLSDREIRRRNEFFYSICVCNDFVKFLEQIRSRFPKEYDIAWRCHKSVLQTNQV